MSLIDQALRKTQSALNKNASSVKSKDSPESIIISPHLKRKRHNRPPYGIIIFSTMSFLAILFLISHTHFSAISHRIANGYHTLFHHKKLPPAPVVQPPPAVQIPPPAETILLNGTLQVGNEHAALINHQLFHIGDIVGGFKIIQIHFNNVVLQNPSTHENKIIVPALSQT